MKVLFVATVAGHITGFHLPYLKMFKEAGWETSVAAWSPDAEKTAGYAIPYCDKYYNIPFERSPLKLRNFLAYRDLKRLIDRERYDIIHCHTPVGAALTRLAATKARGQGCRVIYTAHGFHFYDGAPLLNWLVYYPVEKALAAKTDVLITINGEDYQRARSFKAKEVKYVPGVGIDLNKFRPQPEIRTSKREELGLKEEDFVLLSVGELNPGKNHAVVLDALGLLKDTPEFPRMQYIVCGAGPMEAQLKRKGEELGIAGHVHLLGKRSDMAEIYNSSDMFVFMSLREGLPVSLMEAMACGLPVVCSRIRGNTDLIEGEVSGLIAANNPKAVAEAILRLRRSPQERDALVRCALDRIKGFALEKVKALMRDIYLGHQE